MSDIEKVLEGFIIDDIRDTLRIRHMLKGNRLFDPNFYKMIKKLFASLNKQFSSIEKISKNHQMKYQKIALNERTAARIIPSEMKADASYDYIDKYRNLMGEYTEVVTSFINETKKVFSVLIEYMTNIVAREYHGTDVVDNRAMKKDYAKIFGAYVTYYKESVEDVVISYNEKILSKRIPLKAMEESATRDKTVYDALMSILGQTLSIGSSCTSLFQTDGKAVLERLESISKKIDPKIVGVAGDMTIFEMISKICNTYKAIAETLQKVLS